MPDVIVQYDADEIRYLIQKDMKDRFGVDPSDDAIACDSNDGWTVLVETGTLEVGKRR